MLGNVESSVPAAGFCLSMGRCSRPLKFLDPLLQSGLLAPGLVGIKERSIRKASHVREPLLWAVLSQTRSISGSANIVICGRRNASSERRWRATAAPTRWSLTAGKPIAGQSLPATAKADCGIARGGDSSRSASGEASTSTTLSSRMEACPSIINQSRATRPTS